MDILQTVVQYGVPFLLGFVPVAFYAGKIFNLLKEVSQLLMKVSSLLDDKQVTKEEISDVVKEAKDIMIAIKAFAKK
jgi:uncharacterized protein YoxC